MRRKLLVKEFKNNLSEKSEKFNFKICIATHIKKIFNVSFDCIEILVKKH